MVIQAVTAWENPRDLLLSGKSLPARGSREWLPTIVSAAMAAADAALPLVLASKTTDRKRGTTRGLALRSRKKRPMGQGFAGAVFGGRYVYFVPEIDGNTLDGVIVQYDTQGTFTAASAWSSFDMATVHAMAKNFKGAAFDGRYLYLVPFGVTSGLTIRYDTQASFNAATSWSTFDMTTVNAAATTFIGAAFDGRYLYYVPDFGGLHRSGLVTRFDTEADFTAAASWSTFDMTTVNGAAHGFAGAVFDGRYLYFVPYYDSGTVARFDAKAPPSLPPGYAHGSFL